MTDREPRYKILTVCPHDLIDLLGGWRQKTELRLPLFQGLPTGYEVLDVYVNHRRRLFEVILYHPSFDPVPEGDYIPLMQSFDAQRDLVRLRRILSDDADPTPMFVFQEG